MAKKVKLKELLYTHDIAKMPDDLRRKKNVILAISIATTLIMDILSFSIKGAQVAITEGLNVLAVALLILHFLPRVLRSTIQTYTDNLKNHFNEGNDTYITTSISDIANSVRGKVFQQKGEYCLIMTNPEVTFSLKEFIDYIWKFWQNLPLVIVNSISALTMAVVILVTEWLQTENLKQTLLLSGLLLACIILLGLFYRIRIRVRQQFREHQRKLRKEQEVFLNDVKNIEPLIREEFTYRVNLVVGNLTSTRKLEKKEIFKLNIIQITRTLILAVFMIFIVIIKIISSGGVENITLLTLTDILAVSTVYSNILEKVTSILDYFETLNNTIRDAEKVKPDVDNIMRVSDSENQVEFTHSSDIPEISVNQFEFSYPGVRNNYTLRNKDPFSLKKGKAYAICGHTGCGKTTLACILTGIIKMNKSPISYGSQQDAYLSSIMHQTNGRLGSTPVLQELIFNGDISKLDKSRMLDILHGTHIYEDVLRNLGLTLSNDDKVLEYLNSTTIEQYSSGQKQRLSIVKVLYNLDASHQIVVFDEATNALDDATALSVLQFIKNFCQKDAKRILLFISHQVALVKQIATGGSITFKSEQFPIYDIQADF